MIHKKYTERNCPFLLQRPPARKYIDNLNNTTSISSEEFNVDPEYLTELGEELSNALGQRCPTGGPRCLLQSPPFLPTFRQIFPYHASRFLPQVLLVQLL